jgi:hypothetical protein
VDRLHVGNFRGADDACDLEVAVHRGGRPDTDGLVGQLQVGSIAVGLAEDGDHLDSQVSASADHAQGNFTAVGNQNALEHK